MARTVEEVYEDIRVRFARGHTIDDQLPRLCQQALFWVERNRNLSYMLDRVSFATVPGSSVVELSVSPAKASLLGTLKAVSSLGWAGSSGGWLPIYKRGMNDTYLATEGVPMEYEVEGNVVKFFTVPSAAYIGRAACWRFSIWPHNRNSGHPLLDYADDLVINHVLMQLSPQKRDPTGMQMYKVLRDDALATLNLAQDEVDFPGPEQMLYVGTNAAVFEPVIAP